MNIQRIIQFLLLLVLGVSQGAYAFYCTVLGKNVYGGTSDVYVNLDPMVQVGYNIVVNLGNSIRCLNQDPANYLDSIRIIQGLFSGPLAGRTGRLSYYGSQYNFPLASPTAVVNHTWGSFRPWSTVLYLQVINTGTSGILVTAGQQIASLTMEKVSEPPYLSFTWNIYAANSIVVPTGTCDVSSRNVTVTLPDYPGTVAVPLTVRCVQDAQLSYFLTGTTADTGNTIFMNTSSLDPASGIGVQISNDGGVLATNQNVSLGTVGTSAVSLGLTASYARTGGQVVAGNVQSIIGVTFVYN